MYSDPYVLDNQMRLHYNISRQTTHYLKLDNILEYSIWEYPSDVQHFQVQYKFVVQMY